MWKYFRRELRNPHILYTFKTDSIGALEMDTFFMFLFFIWVTKIVVIKTVSYNKINILMWLKFEVLHCFSLIETQIGIQLLAAIRPV